MTMDDIMQDVITICENDQSIVDTDLIAWVNMAINRINVAVSANIPLMTELGTDTPAFDQRFHESLVLFAIAKYKEGDTQFNDANYFMTQFNNMLDLMQRQMDVAPSQKLGEYYQQITVTDNTVIIYPLTIPYGAYFSDISVYQNDNLVDSSLYTINLLNKNITFAGLALAVNDKLTIQYEDNAELTTPPYSWWGRNEW